MELTVASITRSRNTIAVTSYNFITSNRCKLPLNLAMYEQVERGRNSIIAIRIDDVTTRQLPIGLQTKYVVDYSPFFERNPWYMKVINFLKGN